DPWGTALLGGALPAEARRRVVALRPRLDYGSLLNAAPHVAAIREAARALELTPERGIRVRVTGEPVLNYEELLAIGKEMPVLALGGPPRVRPAGAVPRLMAALGHLPLRFAAPVRVAAVVVAIAAVALLPHIRFDYNLLKLRDPGTESVQAFNDLLSGTDST